MVPKPRHSIRRSFLRLCDRLSFFAGTALAENLLGINSLEKDVYETPEIVQKTHDAGLVFACYGDDVGDNLKLLESAGVDIAIYDR